MNDYFFGTLGLLAKPVTDYNTCGGIRIVSVVGVTIMVFAKKIEQ